MNSKIEVSRDTLIRSMNIEDVEDRFKAIHELRALLAKPAAQHQGEPVAWVTMQPGWSDRKRTVITDPDVAVSYHEACYHLTPLYRHPAEQLAPVVRCPSCGTHEVSLARTCHNSACCDYAKEVTIYEGWKSTAPIFAPVAVVLPEPEAFEICIERMFGFRSNQLCLLSGPDLKRVWLAALEEVKRLNP